MHSTSHVQRVQLIQINVGGRMTFNLKIALFNYFLQPTERRADPGHAELLLSMSNPPDQSRTFQMRSQRIGVDNGRSIERAFA